MKRSDAIKLLVNFMSEEDAPETVQDAAEMLLLFIEEELGMLPPYKYSEAITTQHQWEDENGRH